MQKTTFAISKMDCPSEESLIRLKLDGLAGERGLDFDIHDGRLIAIEQSIASLNLGGRILSTEEAEPPGALEGAEGLRKLLRTVLAINFTFFVIEVAARAVSGSMGLVADSLDMRVCAALPPDTP